MSSSCSSGVVERPRKNAAAGMRRLVVTHGAGAALAGVAADVGAGQAERAAQVVNEQVPRLGFAFVPRAVDGEGYLHRCAPWIACQTRSGVAGMSRWVTPSGRSASRTADITAGGAPMVAPSPTPLTPSGLVRHGTGSNADSTVAGMKPIRGTP